MVPDGLALPENCDPNILPARIPKTYARLPATSLPISQRSVASLEGLHHAQKLKLQKIRERA